MTDKQIISLYVLATPSISALFIILFIAVGEVYLLEVSASALLMLGAVLHTIASTLLVSFKKPVLRQRIHVGTINVLIPIAVLPLVCITGLMTLGILQAAIITFITIFLIINLFQ
jgi:hypothetical protein